MVLSEVVNYFHYNPVAYQFTHRQEILNPGAGGHIMSYASNNKIYLRENSEPNKTIATLIDTTLVPLPHQVDGDTDEL